MARYLIDEDLGCARDFTYDEEGRITGFGVAGDVLESCIQSGQPFETSGRPGNDGRVACNRPYANSRPGPDIRNYPFELEPEDVRKVRDELWS